MLPSHCRNIITPESVSTMQYHCLSLAEEGEEEEEEEEDGGGVITKGFVKGFQGNGGSLFPLACFLFFFAIMLLHKWTHREMIHRSAE